MILLDPIRSSLEGPLAQFLAVPVVEENGGAGAPAMPYLTYDFLNPSGESPGLPVVFYEDGKKKQEETFHYNVYFETYAATKAERIAMALKARDWFLTAGYDQLIGTANTVVVSVATIENADVELGDTVKRHIGFEAVLRTVNTVEEDAEYIETINVKGVDTP